jgi:hypothetical protein
MNRLIFLFLIILAPAQLSFAADASPEALAKARAEYPSPSCVVSGEHLEAGKIVEYVYKQEGKPDRLVRLCCHKCEARFKANPVKYLERLDAAAAKAAKKN